MSADDGIRAFWAWWETARHRVFHAIEVAKHFDDELITDISSHVDAIGDLDWELCAGTTAKHAFCLSPKGDPELRLVTELWRHHGPAADESWEYFAARQPGDNSGLIIEDVEFKRDALTVAFEVDRARERIDVSFYHPRFPEVDEHRRGTALFLLLDSTFGEDGVERWLGSIDVLTEPPDGAVSFAALRAAVDELERTATREKFAILEVEPPDGSPLFFTVNQALKRIDHLLCTMHVAIDLAILDQNPRGLTTQADAEQLNQIEDELARDLRKVAVYFGRETRPGHRVLHWYAPEDSAAQAIIERWAQHHRDRRPTVTWTRDAGWSLARQLGRARQEDPG